MSKFNEKKVDKDLTLNEEEALAYKKSEKEALVSMVLTTFYNEDKFYGDNSEELVELAKRMIKKDAKFVANLAVFARNQMYLRSVSHVLCALLANIPEGKEFVKYACENCILRADDILEILAFYVNTYGKPIPNSLKKALANAMDKFDEYQFAKYNRKGREFNFKDVLRLTHAKAKSEEKNELYKKIITDSLETPYTWETELSKRGNKKEVWEELIASKRLGYLALLRNLNNILTVKPENLSDAIATLTNKTLIANNKVLPFRYYSAYRRLRCNKMATSKIYDALEDAIEASVENMEKLSGKTLIAVDVSGSMGSCISGKSDVCCCDIARILAAISNYICEESICVAFDDKLQVVALSNRSGIIKNAESIKFNGGGTYCHLPFEYLNNNEIFVDRIIMLSDNMCNFSFYNPYEIVEGKKTITQAALDKYVKNINKDVVVHAVDLQGYSTKQLKYGKVNFITGWSENILTYINYYEKGVTSLIKDIEEYEIKK